MPEDEWTMAELARSLQRIERAMAALEARLPWRPDAYIR